MTNRYWILPCNTSRYDVHTLFKENGYCLWNQRRDFQIGDIVYIYETKPVSRIIYKTIVEEINLKRDKPENSDNFYTRDYNKEYAFKLRCIAFNTSNRLQYKELNDKFGITGMSLLHIIQIERPDIIEFFEDVFDGKVEDIPAPPTKEELYEPLLSGTMLQHIKHKMDFCEIRDSHLAKKTGISGSSIGKVRKGDSIKAENVLVILDALGFGFTDYDNECRVYNALEIVNVIKNKIISTGIRTTDLATKCKASPSVISHLKNNATPPKLEILEDLLSHFNLKVVLRGS